MVKQIQDMKTLLQFLLSFLQYSFPYMEFISKTLQVRRFKKPRLNSVQTNASLLLFTNCPVDAQYVLRSAIGERQNTILQSAL